MLIRGTVDVHGESGSGRSAAGFGEPPPPPKGLAGATPKGKKGKNKVKPMWDPLNGIVDMPPPSGHVDKNMEAANDGETTKTRQVGVKARFPATKGEKPGTTRL